MQWSELGTGAVGVMGDLFFFLKERELAPEIGRVCKGKEKVKGEEPSLLPHKPGKK